MLELIPTWCGSIDSLLLHGHVGESNIALGWSHQSHAERGFEGRLVKAGESFSGISRLKFRCGDGNIFSLGVSIDTLIEPSDAVSETSREGDVEGVITRWSSRLREDNPELVLRELKDGAERHGSSVSLQCRLLDGQLLGVDQEVICWAGGQDINSNLT